MSKHIVVSFSRNNPITAGHEKLFDHVSKIAKDVGGEAHCHMSHSNDPKKNPLTHDDKVSLAKDMMPHHAHMFRKESGVKTLFHALSHHSDPNAELHVVAGSDRVDEYKKKLNEYNGKDFHYKKIHVHSAGARDPDAEGTTGISGTKMRSHATNGSYADFKAGALTTAKEHHIRSMYDKIRSASPLPKTIKECIREMFSRENKEFKQHEMNHELRGELNSDYRRKPKATGMIYHPGGSKTDSKGRKYDFHFGSKESGQATANHFGGKYSHFGAKTIREFLEEATIKLTGKKTKVELDPELSDYKTNKEVSEK